MVTIFPPHHPACDGSGRTRECDACQGRGMEVCLDDARAIVTGAAEEAPNERAARELRAMVPELADGDWIEL